MGAFRTPEKPDLALICSPELAKPPEREVILALGALDLDGWKRLDLFILNIDDGDLLLFPGLIDFQRIRVIDFPDISAFFAFELPAGRNEHALAFWTKHRFNNGQPEKINLWIT